MPKANAEYWSSKIGRNQARDAKILAQLRSDGWKVLTVWECELSRRDLFRRLAEFLEGRKRKLRTDRRRRG
jgi:DNA mismatch endonuclease (patch repair protein)